MTTDYEQQFHDSLERIAEHGETWRRMVAERDAEIERLREVLVAKCRDWDTACDHRDEAQRERDQAQRERDTLKGEAESLRGEVERLRALCGDGRP